MIAEFRPNARSGLWITFLLPIALIISTSTTTSNALPGPPQNHVIICILALEMCLYSTVFAFALFPTKKSLFLDNAAEIQEKLHFKTIWKPTVYIMICSLLLSLFVGSDVFILMLLSFVAMMSYIQSLPMIWIRFRKSFTFGEGVLVLQSGVLFGVKFISNIFWDVHDPTTIGYNHSTHL